MKLSKIKNENKLNENSRKCVRERRKADEITVLKATNKKERPVKSKEKKEIY